MDYIADLLKLFDMSSGVSIDTRTLKAGEIFFALKGENFDGNDFVPAALEKGALAAVTSSKRFAGDGRVFVVPGALEALQALATAHRRRLDVPVVGITGTNGKTTTKELLCSMLGSKYRTLCTKGNLNNHIGVPLNILALNKNHQVAVIEMGASAPGEIDFLCRIAMPTHALITSVGRAHIEGFGSFENVIKTKTELYRYVKEAGNYFFYNKDLKDISKEIEDYPGLVKFNARDFDGNHIEKVEMKNTYPFLELHFATKDKEGLDVKTKIYGEYNFVNIVNAAKIADFFDVPVQEIKDALEDFIPAGNRSQVVRWHGNKLILDAYNANPTSMQQAIKSFSKIKSPSPKIMILGDMLEMGQESHEAHYGIARLVDSLADKSLQKVYFIGGEFYKVKDKPFANGERFVFVRERDSIANEIQSPSFTGNIVLVKGSRGIGLEKLFNSL